MTINNPRSQRHARLYVGHPRLESHYEIKVVDARDKRGHDGVAIIVISNKNTIQLPLRLNGRRITKTN